MIDHLHILADRSEFLNKNYEGRWTGKAQHAQSPNLNPSVSFPRVCMKSRVYHDGKPGGSNHLQKARNETVVGSRNKLGHVLRQHSLAQELEAWIQSNDEHFEQVLH
jgi:hypothetical protein